VYSQQLENKKSWKNLPELIPSFCPPAIPLPTSCASWNWKSCSSSGGPSFRSGKAAWIGDGSSSGGCELRSKAMGAWSLWAVRSKWKEMGGRVVRWQPCAFVVCQTSAKWKFEMCGHGFLAGLLPFVKCGCVYCVAVVSPRCLTCIVWRVYSAWRTIQMQWLPVLFLERGQGHMCNFTLLVIWPWKPRIPFFFETEWVLQLLDEGQ